MDISHDPLNITDDPQEIQRLKDEILQIRFCNPPKAMEHCQKLIRAGEAGGDDSLLGFACYYLAEGYFVQNEYADFVAYLMKSIPHQQNCAQWNLLTRSYNMLGINAHMQGNAMVALDHFIRALKYCKEYDFGYEKAMVLTNIGHLYLEQRDYKSALKYLNDGRDLFLEHEANPFSDSNIVLIDIAVGRCYLYLNDVEQAQKQDLLIREREQSLVSRDYSLIPIFCFRAKLRHLLEKYDVRDRYISQVITDIKDCTSILDICDDILDLCLFLLEIEKVTEMAALSKTLQKIIDDLGITKLKRDMLRVRIKYYEKTGDREKYLEACAQQYELGETFREENISMMRKSTELRFSLEEARQKEELFIQEKTALIKKSETDALTNLPNRYKMNEYAEYIFEKALKEKKSLGVEMLDIDYFKEYNDTYGHQAGDTCIRLIADCLQKLAEDENVFCARYGGDEFIIIYYGRTDEEILRIAGKMKNVIQEQNMVHEKSPISDRITISQGIRNTVPVSENKIWDFTFSADMALYKMKKEGRNGVYLVHKMTAESIDTVLLKYE